MKLIPKGIIFSFTVTALICFTGNAQAKPNCFMIDSSGRRIDLNSLCHHPNNPSANPNGNNTNTRRNSPSSPSSTNQSERKSCIDFSLQPEAQDYMIKHRASYLDNNYDGIACEEFLPIPPEFGEVTQDKWEQLYMIHYNRDQPFTLEHDAPLTLSEAQSIMEFSGVKFYVQTNGDIQKWRWRDIKVHSKKIEITFINGRVHTMSATGL